MNYEEAMNYINSFSKRGGSISDLSRFSSLMDRLGNPQDNLKFVHIAGTNGKGSVVSYLSSVLTLCGYKTGEFTSPYIVDYTDRIRINGENISKDAVPQYVEKIREMALNEEYSQFEITTALAFLYFNDMKCDIVCLETGVGGLLDCTNIIKPPLVTVITAVSFDHTAVLGNTIEKISFQKAGIIKNGTPCVLSADNIKECVDVVTDKCKQCKSSLIIPDKNELNILSSDILGSSFIYKGNEYELSMAGKHQVFNAISAIEALNVLKCKGYDISYQNVRDGLKKSTVPSRTEIFRKKPLILVDGAHNPAGMEALSNILKDFPKKPVAILGMINTKDAETALSKIAPFVERVVCVDGFYPNALDSTVVQKILLRYNVNAKISKDIDKTVNDVIQGTDDAVFCGSLYLTSIIRKLIIKKLK